MPKDENNSDPNSYEKTIVAQGPPECAEAARKEI
jgi:hypothetical protein